MDQLDEGVAAALDRAIADRLPAATVALGAMVRQPSVSATGEGVADMAELLAGFMRACGLEPDVHATGLHPIVSAAPPGPRSHPTVLLYGHYDVQPVGPPERWSVPPFAAEIRDGRMFGRGSADSKGQLVAALVGVAAALDVARDLPLGVVVVADGEEEIGSPSLREFLIACREQLAADVAYVADGAMHASGRPLVALGSRGLLCIELTAADERPDLHSGSFGGVVDSPAWRLARALASLRGTDGAITVEGFLDGVAAGDIDVDALIAALPPPVLPWVPAATLAPADHYRRLCTLPALNLSGLQSGYVGPGLKTAIPSEASARLDARLVPDQDPEQVLAALRDHLDRCGHEVTLRVLAATPPYMLSSRDPWARAVVAQVAEVYGEDPVVLPVLPGTVPVAIIAEALGVPAVVVPHANADQNNHAPDENLRLDALTHGARTMARLLLREAGTNRPGLALPR